MTEKIVSCGRLCKQIQAYARHAAEIPDTLFTNVEDVALRGAV